WSGNGALTATDPASMDLLTGGTGATASVRREVVEAPLATTPEVGAAAGAAAEDGAGVDSHDARGIVPVDAAAATGSATAGGRSRPRTQSAVGTASISTSAASTAIAIDAC